MGVGLTTPNALAIALEHYKDAIGTASAVFGCFYYALISLFTFGISIIHNGTLIPMPLYFLAISIFMLLTFTYGVKNRS